MVFFRNFSLSSKSERQSKSCCAKHLRRITGSSSSLYIGRTYRSFIIGHLGHKRFLICDLLTHSTLAEPLTEHQLLFERYPLSMNFPFLLKSDLTIHWVVGTFWEFRLRGLLPPCNICNSANQPHIIGTRTPCVANPVWFQIEFGRFSCYHAFTIHWIGSMIVSN